MKSVTIENIKLDELVTSLEENDFTEIDQSWGVVGITEWLKVNYKHQLGSCIVNYIVDQGEEPILYMKFDKGLNQVVKEKLLKK